MQAVVLAAGRGHRLGSLGQTRSKAMQPILGIPIIGHILADLNALGWNEIIVVTAAQDDGLQGFLRRPGIDGVTVRQVVQTQPLGMAHALEQAAGLLHQDFLLIACDNRVPRVELHNMIDHWQQRPELQGLLGLLEIPASKVSQSGIVKMRGAQVVQIVEKPAPGAAPSSTASIPFYCLRPAFLDILSAVEVSARGERELQDALQVLIDRSAQVEGWHFSQRKALSYPEDLLSMNLQALQRQLPASDVRSKQIASGVQFIPPLLVEAQVVIGAGSLIGPNVYLEAGARIGRQVRLSECLVLRQGRIADGCAVHGAVIGQKQTEG